MHKWASDGLQGGRVENGDVYVNCYTGQLQALRTSVVSVQLLLTRRSLFVADAGST